MTSDEELFAAAMSGGAEGFAPIVERYQDAVFGIALARLGDFHAAEDVAQSVFVAAFERLGSLRDPRRLGAWLRSLTIHTAIRVLRRRRERPGVAVDDPRDSRAAQPHDELSRRELREQVLAAIGRLTRTQRETTTLFYINGYSVAEVAAIQEVPVGTIKSRLHDARQRLKEDLIGMVEDVLKSEAPKEDFSDRVLRLVTRYRLPPKPPWSSETKAIVAELRKIGGAGAEGFVRAMESPHSPTRVFAARVLAQAVVPGGEPVVELLKRCLSDPNRKVRMFAMEALLRWEDADRRRKKKEFLPLIVPLLHDPSRTVRGKLAWRLLRDGWAADIPLVEVVRAFLDEPDDPPGTKGMMEGLMRAVLEPREDKRQT